jgi:hypothetical protein
LSRNLKKYKTTGLSINKLRKGWNRTEENPLPKTKGFLKNLQPQVALNMAV